MFSLLQTIRNSQQSTQDRRARLYQELIRREAKLGGRLFGPVPPNVRREFFCLDEHTWIWHEEWVDNNKQRHVITTRYDVRPNGILKAQDGQAYRYIDLEEARRLYKVVQMYNNMVQAEFSPQS